MPADTNSDTIDFKMDIYRVVAAGADPVAYAKFKLSLSTL